MFYISARICNVVIPGKVPTPTPSALRLFDPVLDIEVNYEPINILLPALTGFEVISPIHNTESEKTKVFAVAD